MSIAVALPLSKFCEVFEHAWNIALGGRVQLGAERIVERSDPVSFGRVYFAVEDILEPKAWALFPQSVCHRDGGSEVLV